MSVVLSTDMVNVAEIRRTEGARPTVLFWESLPIGNDALAALKKLRPRLTGRCTTLLRHGQYQIVQTEAPEVAAEDRRDAVRWRIKDTLEFPAEAAGVDVLDIPGGGGAGRGPQVFGVAASHEVLRPLIHLFQDADVSLSAIDIPELALRNVAALFEEEGRGLALLAFNAEGGRIIFTFKQELFATRRIDVKVADLMAPGREAPGGVFERVLLDVQRSLDNFDRNFSFITLSKLMVAPIPGVEALVEYLKANLYQPVELLDLGAVMDLDQVPGLRDAVKQGIGLCTIGAALRSDGGGK